MTGVSIVFAGAERVDELEPLWGALVEHQAAVATELPGIPSRTPADSWTYRRAEYAEWLSEPDAFAAIAEVEGRAVGYALVHFHDVADDHWVTLERWAELESLIVLSEHRGDDVGARLMDAVHERLRALGIREMVIGVVSSNDDAIRFYERYGYRPWITKFLGVVPDADSVA